MVCDRFAFDREERAVALFALACFGPLLYSLREGNISHILLPALVWGICLLDARKDWQAGLVFGLLAVFKPLLFLVVVYLAARARFAAAFAGTATCIAFVGLSVLVFGWDTHLAWYGEAIAPYSKNPIAGFNAQSIASFIARFETGIPGYADWAPHALAPGAAMAVRALSIAVVAACLWAALSGGWRARPDTSETECEIHMTVLTACLISTLSWSHYYVWLLPAFAFLYVFGRRGAISPAWGSAAAGAYVLTAPIEYLSDHAGGSAILSNLIVSGRMFGGVALLAVLLRLRVQLQPRRLSGIAPVARHEA
jgi:alpha-1,2-mannosyltransferase